jgi:hypothetical protein
MNLRVFCFPALAFALMAALAAPVGAQQSTNPSTTNSTTRATPGVLPGTTGTTFDTPGAQQPRATPGGTVPMGAATQDKSNRPTDPPNYNNSAPRRPSR